MPVDVESIHKWLLV